MAASILVILAALVAGLVLSVAMTWAGNRSIAQNMALAALVLVGVALLLLALPAMWRRLGSL